ncbi:MAG: hypothetical protein K0U86_20075 [Planctomycetes bacterium]|nr:hypothetical protein [Planctomycetota bacterium]MCH9727200.1 hypothetical protein [Planctomycetota bacterium]MCH9778593.1 hypothetical protein [Planctomycetota bacterium]MCH9790968.1 hypothetical protein [Planctomycetota bacterium]
MNSRRFFAINSHNICRVFVLAVLFNFPGLPQIASAQDDPFAADQEKMTPKEQEEAAQELIKGINRLVLSQQKRIARKVIRLYPKSESAKVAKLLLDEYQRFDQIKEEEAKADTEWLNQVRNHWFREKNPQHDSFFFTVLKGTQKSAVKLSNQSKLPVLYELKGPSMPWVGPYRLSVGESHEFYYSAQVRFFSDQGVVVKHLLQGQTLLLDEKNTLHIKQ